MRRLGAADFATNLAAAHEMGAAFRAIRNAPLPVVARVQGAAYGGGVGLACACDIVVASQAASFCFSEVRLGLVPGVIAPLVVDRIGAGATRAAFLTAEPIRAVDAFRLGIVDRLSDADGLDEAVARTVTAVLAGGPVALGRAKALVDGTLALGYERSADFTAQAIAEARTAGEAQAALRSFFARERAPWTVDAWSPPASGPAGECP
jgi:methylglutaconyl-CoA hydratase